MFTTLFSMLKQAVFSVMAKVQQAVKHGLKPHTTSLVIGVVSDGVRSKGDLMLENALLRQQLSVVDRQIKRPRFTARDRVIILGLTSLLRGWKQAVLLIQPETVLHRHRRLFKGFWRRKSRHTGGKAPRAADGIALIQQMARENRLWGAERIRGEFLKLGLRVSKSTIQSYLPKDRSPQPSQTWRTSLHNHAHQIWACDFIQITDLWFRALFVFVMVEPGSRRVVHVGVTRQPTDAWVAQQVREATPFGQGPRFLLRDNDCKYGHHVWAVTEGAGIEVLKTPLGAPKANAICERFIRSVRRECLDHLFLLGEKPVQRVMQAYVAYFNHERPHQGIGRRIPEHPLPSDSPPTGVTVMSCPILGGLHHAYSWRAA